MVNRFVLLLVIGALVALLATAQPGVGQTIPGAAGLYLPLVLRQEPPTPTVTPTPTVPPTPIAASTPTPTLTPSATATLQLLYICDRDAYNCTSFQTQAQAQAVYNYCVARGFGDIHKLDSDNDGEVCESLP